MTRPCNAARALPGTARAESGQAIIEMVIVLPLLLLVVFGIVEFAAAWRTFHVVTNSTREGARRAVVLGGTGNTAEVENAVRTRLAAGGLDPDLATITVSCDPGDGTAPTAGVCGGTDAVGKADVVNVVFPFPFLLLGPVAELICDGCGDQYGTVNLTAQTIMRHE